LLPGYVSGIPAAARKAQLERKGESMKASVRSPHRLLVIWLLALVAVVSAQSGGSAQAEVSAQAADSLVGPGESIQKAVNAADPGDTIVVRGVHREDVVIRKDGIKLRGDDAVIEAPTRAKADSPCSKLFGPEAICVLGDENIKTGKLEGPRVSDVSVSGFTIRGFEIEGKGDNDAFVIEVIGARNATVVGNRAIGNAASGINAFGSTNTTVARNDVTGDPTREVEGINVSDGRNTKIVNNVVKDYFFGIEADANSVNTTIAGNKSIGNSVVGISSLEATGTKMLSNTTRRNEVLGIFLGFAERANAKVVGNNISGGPFGIYVVDTKRGSIAGNTIHDNCAGMVFEASPSQPVGDFEVKANTVEDNTRSCRAPQFDRNVSGIGIALLSASGMELTANHLSGNVPSGPTPVSGGVVVSTDPFFGETIKPRNNSVIGNHFGRNKPDIFWDESGSGNRFVGNLCNTSVPSRLCN
jgi:parallel beta-helix repeat protein